MLSALSVYYIALIALLLASLTWLLLEPGFEALVASLAIVAEIVRQAVKQHRHYTVPALLRNITDPITRLTQMQRAVASAELNTVTNNRIIRHAVRGVRIWNDSGPTGQIELRQRCNKGTWTAFDKLEGHSLEFQVDDIDADNKPELIATYCAGAHTHVIQIYKADDDGQLRMIPGSQIGSDWPEITCSKDSQGKIEIVAKNRDWDNDPAGSPPVQERYNFVDGEIRPRSGFK